MTELARPLLVAGVATVVGIPAFAVFISLGPDLWLPIVVFLLAIGGLVYLLESMGGGSSAPAGPGTNCPSCGSQNPADARRCEYCDEPL